MKRPYRARLFERRIKQVPYRKTDRRYLRKDPAIMPLEATVKLQDPRGAPNMSFLDVCDLMEEEMKDPAKNQQSIEITKKTGKSEETEDTENQLKDETATTDLMQEILDSSSNIENSTDPGSTMKSTRPVSPVSTAASSEIEELHLLLDSLSQTLTENEKKLNCEENFINPGSTSPEEGLTTLSEIHEFTPLLDSPGSQAKKTDKSMKNDRLSTFELEIIDLFDIPEEILETTAEIRSSHPATSLDLSIAALSENTCFLDLLEDGNTIYCL